jgi:hypothetical protein
MHDTTERIRIVKLRVGKLHRTSETRSINALSALCILLLLSLMGAINTMAGGGTLDTVPGMYGSMLLYDGAGGYVLVGVISFALAVVITMLCIRYRGKSKT